MGRNPWAQFLCPTVCQCAKPDSLVPSHLADMGCPTACISTSNYTTRLGQLSCTNIPVPSLKGSDYWIHWRDYVNATLLTVYGSQTYAEAQATTMWDLGCDWLPTLPYTSKRELCEGSSALIKLRPLAPICPVACECSSGQTLNCAPQCVTR